MRKIKYGLAIVTTITVTAQGMVIIKEHHEHVPEQEFIVTNFPQMNQTIYNIDQQGQQYSHWDGYGY